MTEIDKLIDGSFVEALKMRDPFVHLERTVRQEDLVNLTLTLCRLIKIDPTGESEKYQQPTIKLSPQPPTSVQEELRQTPLHKEPHLDLQLVQGSQDTRGEDPKKLPSKLVIEPDVIPLQRMPSGNYGEGQYLPEEKRAVAKGESLLIFREESRSHFCEENCLRIIDGKAIG